MNEKQKEIVEQYDVKVESTYRNRGCLHLVTDKGIFIVTSYQGSPLRLALEYELQMKLLENEFDRLDFIVPNKEGGFIVYDKYRTPFILKRTYDGRECNLKELKDLKEASRNLARFHKTVRNFSDYTVENRKTPLIPEVLKAKTLELKRIRNYIKKSGRRTDFELTFTSCYEQFYGDAMDVLSLVNEQEKENWQQGYGICHGAYHQHNVLMGNGFTATLNLGQFHFNQQMLDFYGLLRKALEKNHYERRIMEAALNAYREEIPLERADYVVLYILLAYPEKFWKISNQYYNSKKCWMPPKNLEKLKYVVEQNKERKQLLKEWKRDELTFL